MAPITSYFHKASPEELAEQSAQASQAIKEFRAWQTAKKQALHLSKTKHERALASARQQKFRLKQRELDVQLGLRDPQTHKRIKAMQLHQHTPEEPNNSSPDPEAIAHPNTAFNAAKPAEKKKRAPRTVWSEPILWGMITAAAKRAGFSKPQAIVNELQRGPNGAMFKTLDRGTVGSWINRERTVATPREAPRVAREGVRLGRPRVMDKFPGLANEIVQYLTTVRLAGIPVTRTVAHGTVLAFINSKAPALLSDSHFKCSDTFIRDLLKSQLNWSYRTTTQAAQKLPNDWESQCVDMANRLTWNIALHNIPAELVINADQTGVAYLGTGDKTWELKGSKQVPVIGKGDKRQFTLMVAITASGIMLPWQAIFKGRSTASLPSVSARRECESLGFHFMCGGDKHWSTFKCMQEWVNHVLVPHIDSHCRNEGLGQNQKSILLIDCWSVHRGDEFRSWMRNNFPNIIILFIPGGCTGVAQPCDLNINRTLKHLIKSACVKHLATETEKQLRHGIAVTDVTIDTSPGALRNACTSWLFSTWQWFIDHPDAVLKAWSQAVFKGGNLAYDTLNSRKSCSDVRERFVDDPNFTLMVCTERPVTNNSMAEEDVDGPDYDDDSSLDPDVLCDIRLSAHCPTTPQLPTNVVEFQGSLIYSDDICHSEP